MTHAKLVCAHCGHEQDIDMQYVGQQFACPRCGQTATAVAREVAAPPPPPPSGGPGVQASAAAQRMRAFASTALADPAFITTGIDRLLDTLAGIFKAERYERQIGWLTCGAQYAVLVAMPCALIAGVVMAFRLGSLLPFGLGLAAVLCLMFLQYAAVKGLEMVANIRRSSVVYLSGPAYFRIGAAFVLFSLLVLFVLLLASSFGGRYFGGIGVGVGEGLVVLCVLALVYYFLLYLVLHPTQMLGLQFREETTAGEEFLSLIGLGVKIWLVLTPLFHALGTIGAGLFLLYGTGMALFNSNPMESGQTLLESLGGLAFALFLPLLAYLVCISLYHFVDLGLALFRT